jgi:hypothetical protein
MANDNRPEGLLPVKHLNGYNICPVRFVKDSTTGIGKGDVVAIASDGKIDRWLAASSLMLGVAAEASATNVAATIGVLIDPNIVFRAQSTASRAQTHVGNAVGITATAYNATLGISKYQLGTATSTVSATYPLKIVGLAPVPNSDGSQNAFGSFVKLDVVMARGYTVLSTLVI